jgi:hypothetical protein
MNLASQGALLSINNGALVTVENIILEGISTNVSALVTVDHSTFTLGKKASISKNMNRLTDGGGIWATNSQLTVDGEIFENTVKSTKGARGGGIAATSTSITLTGAIHHNLVDITEGKGYDVWGGGGGMNLIASKLNILNGFIESNEVHVISLDGWVSGAVGGGLSLDTESETIFQSGMIRGNRAISAGNSWTGSSGGGVNVEGSFIMKNGTISGNIAESSVPYQLIFWTTEKIYMRGASGGGILVGQPGGPSNAGKFVKEGGILYGANEPGFDPDGFPCKNLAAKGASIYVDRTTIKKFTEVTLYSENFLDSDDLEASVWERE